MDKDLKKKWIDALRSGKYKQGDLYLCNNDEYCCLGVLGNILPEEFLFEIRDVEKTGITYIRSGQEFVGVDDLLPIDLGNEIGINLEMQEQLSNMNDGGYTFEEIADFIEDNIIGI